MCLHDFGAVSILCNTGVFVLLCFLSSEFIFWHHSFCFTASSLAYYMMIVVVGAERQAVHVWYRILLNDVITFDIYI